MKRMPACLLALGSLIVAAAIFSAVMVSRAASTGRQTLATIAWLYVGGAAVLGLAMVSAGAALRDWTRRFSLGESDTIGSPASGGLPAAEEQPRSLDDQIEDIEVEFREEVLVFLHGLSSADSKAARILYERVLDSCQTLHLLRRIAEHRWEIDGVTILRAAWDATIQLLWLLKEPDKREERARLYLAFPHIDVEHKMRWIKTSTSDAAKTLRGSRLRHLGEQEHEEVMKTIGADFVTRKQAQKLFATGDKSGSGNTVPKYRKQWYPGSLRGLAESVGYVDEYDFFQFDASTSVHSAALPLMSGPTVGPDFQAYLASRFALRAAGALVQAFGVPLDDTAMLAIRDAQRSLVDAPVIQLPVTMESDTKEAADRDESAYRRRRDSS